MAFAHFLFTTFIQIIYKVDEAKSKEVSDEVLEQFKMFVGDCDTLRMSRNIRIIFFDYLKFQQGNLNNNFDEILFDVEQAIDFFESISGSK
ncbi:hypothetical protein [Flavobacterium sp. UBA7682]|uniref:hypothetical protein n=1 Tax=Flavobacterium sp. UBA7682 TaxID=1946560 RepID=UPI0025C5263C|nr:hypothetical protein [Flavobacterium sp. UBA7682]